MKLFLFEIVIGAVLAAESNVSNLCHEAILYSDFV
uniref:Uncharacterized protein n=1 Tax=Setaria viridis TaxID=4556 RepID=A0A4U6U863_SETVI|nr:hypothetical protein SEVIR_6G115150v2 [Setaria viridis]